MARNASLGWQFRPERALPPSSLPTSRLCLLPALVLVLAGGCQPPPAHRQGNVTPSMDLRSASFVDTVIPKKCTCDGQDVSPELSWGSPPEVTKSLVLIATDKDSRFGPVVGYFLHWMLGYFVHWVVYDIPPEKHELPEGLPTSAQLPDGSRQGQNDFDKTGYGGPCPPGQSSHRYVFALYSLDTKLDLPAGTSKEEVIKRMAGHVLAKGELVGHYHVRPD